MSPLEVDRRISQLDNDVSEIYTMIADVQNTQRRHTLRFNEVGERHDRMITDLDDLKQRMGSVEGRLEGVEGRLEGIGGRLDEVLRLLQDRG